MAYIKVILRTATPEDEKAVMSYREEFLRESNHIAGSSALGAYAEYSEWLDHVSESFEHGNPSRKLVKSTQYIVFNDEATLVGVIQLRHSLNDYLHNYGGHIGYSVRPSQRGKGYATAMLRECLVNAAEIGLSKVLVTCDETNIASEKVITKCGGLYEDSRHEPEAAVATKRFWISTGKN